MMKSENQPRTSTVVPVPCHLAATEFRDGAVERGEADEREIASLEADSSPGLEIIATVDRREFRQLQRIHVIAEVKNISRIGLFMVPVSNLELRARIRVFNDQGRLVPMTSYYKHGMKEVQLSGGLSGNAEGAIKQGDTRRYNVVANLLYDMTQPGDYWVLVEIPLFFSSSPDSQNRLVYARARPIQVRVIPEPLEMVKGRVGIPDPDRP